MSFIGSLIAFAALVLAWLGIRRLTQRPRRSDGGRVYVHPFLVVARRRPGRSVPLSVREATLSVREATLSRGGSRWRRRAASTVACNALAAVGLVVMPTVSGLHLPVAAAVGGGGELLYDINTQVPPSSIAIGSQYAVETAQRVNFFCAGTVNGVWWFRTAADTGTNTARCGATACR